MSIKRQTVGSAYIQSFFMSGSRSARRENLELSDPRIMSSQSPPNPRSRRYELNFTAKEEKDSKQDHNNSFSTRMECNESLSPSSRLISTFKWSFNVSPRSDSTAAGTIRMRHEVTDDIRSPEIPVHRSTSTKYQNARLSVKVDAVLRGANQLKDATSEIGATSKNKIVTRNKSNVVAKKEHPVQTRNASNNGAVPKQPMSTRTCSSAVNKLPKPTGVDKNSGAISKIPRIPNMTKSKSHDGEARINLYKNITSKIDTGRFRQDTSAPKSVTLRNDSKDSANLLDRKNTVSRQPDSKLSAVSKEPTSSSQFSVKNKILQPKPLARTKSSDVPSVRIAPGLVPKIGKATDARPNPLTGYPSVSPRRFSLQVRAKEKCNKDSTTNIAALGTIGESYETFVRTRYPQLRALSTALPTETSSTGLNRKPLFSALESLDGNEPARYQAPTGHAWFEDSSAQACGYSEAEPRNPLPSPIIPKLARASRHREVEPRNLLPSPIIPKLARASRHREVEPTNPCELERKFSARPGEARGTKRRSFSEGQGQGLVDQLDDSSDDPLGMLKETSTGSLHYD